MILARWCPRVLLRYLKEAPLKTITQRYRQLVGAAGPNHITAQDNTMQEKALEEVRKKCEAICNELELHECKLKKLAKSQQKSHGTYYVVNCTSKKARVHLSSSPIHSIPQTWITYCGWPFAKWQYERKFKLDDDEQERICGQCLRSKTRSLPSESDSQSSQST